MKEVRSFVRRNSRLTNSQKTHLSAHSGMLREQLPEVLPSHFQSIGLEIGFGMGDSLLDVARKNPNQLWIGIEVYEVGIASVIRQAKEENMDNILLLRGDAIEMLSNKTSDLRLDHVRVFFPDPWPKKRHHKRRLLSAETLSLLAKHMTLGGLLHVATDHELYAEDVNRLLASHDSFTLCLETLYRPLTKFAVKAIAAGSTITDIVARTS
ncbi:tRNA (guanosine(46)-N7)-methyltransferase TrmB [Candidatus Synchoanobacter obligatus]|uniref:tRNA (guanine-N(7)-)-methyltransferase n=1 Tax=Candidatus Synchoanobacter obligatus TaxID=2919597 RepID=A0ABT1L3R9_9GAMM|nr:tRNA (guanosine(46)-N7)-methyltransferase TrmB [Candidatus Synchoanobacter obligatus]MCP8351852.1 tRNA (guanosine(46)-N7)-methyltransferase TrmB [Candidatus Synchoanobacter obligatus]